VTQPSSVAAPAATAAPAAFGASWPAAPAEAVADGALWVETDADAAPLLARWRPRPHPHPGAERCRLRVGAPGSAAGATVPPGGAPSLRMDAVRGWVDEGRGRVTLRGEAGYGVLSIVERAGWVDPCGDPGDAVPLLTIATGVLLGAVGQLLMHAGAVVAPDGRAWLVVGDAWAGKSTTVLTLARAGWGWLSDDTVALASGAPGGVVVHAWARTPHLDVGWEDGRVTRRRAEVPLARVGPGRWQATAPLGGILLSRVDAEAPTALAACDAPDAFAGLVRQAPWAVVSRHVASALTLVAQRAAMHPAYTLRLGLDTYGRPERLAAVIGAAIAAPGT